MMLRLVLIFILCVTKAHQYSQTREILHSMLEQTTDFFAKLKLEYEPEIRDRDIIDGIEEKIAEFITNATDPIMLRRKREFLNRAEFSNRDIVVLDRFEVFLNFNVSQIRDISFFSIQDNDELNWFVAVLDSSRVSLLQMVNFTSFKLVAFYPQLNGTRIIVDSCIHGALLIIQNQDGTILVLRMIKPNLNYSLYRIQDFESHEVTHLTTWRGMNQLYLGVASYSNITIYTWLGEHFDEVQVIDLGAEQLIPFYSKGFMHLVATGSSTTILRYSLRTNKYVTIQKLPSSRGALTFQVKEGHFVEYFLCLSTESFVVLYKELHGRFVPFQRFPSGSSTVSITENKTILLLSLHVDTVVTYQYDGWRFVRSSVNLSGVRQIRRADLIGKEFLLVEYENDKWVLKEPIWVWKKSSKDLQDEIQTWCLEAKDRAGKVPTTIPELKVPVRILKGHIDRLSVRNVNGNDAGPLTNVTSKYEKVVSRLAEVKSFMKLNESTDNSVITTLRGKKVRVQCKSKCKVTRVNIENSYKSDPAESTKKTKCPLPGVPVESIIVKKLFNGISLPDLDKNLLKIKGNQQVSGKHSFANLKVKDAILSLNIVSRFTKEEIKAKNIKVKELNLVQGGLLLPLNGALTTITGSIEAMEVKIKGNVTLNGRLSGKAFNGFLPSTLIPEAQDLKDNYTLGNVIIENILKIDDLIINKEKSIAEILSNAISLRDNVPVSLFLASKNMKWNNVTLRTPRNWITANSKDKVIISGRKIIPHNLTVTKYTYDHLQLPEIETQFCGLAAIIPGVNLSSITMDNVFVKKLDTSEVHGDLGKKNPDVDSSFEPFDLSHKSHYRKVSAKNISATHIGDIDLRDLKKLVDSWMEPNTYKGSIETMDLTIKMLKAPVQFSVKLPNVIRNMVAKGNMSVGKINGIDFVDFLANVIKLNDTLSIQNITFSNGFSANNTYVTQIPLNLSSPGVKTNLQKKKISGSLESNIINLPFSFTYAKNKTPPSLIIHGSAVFSSEPTVRNVNKFNLKKLTEEIWMAHDSTVFSGTNLNIENATMRGDLTLNFPLSTSNSGPWQSIARRVLSKTKPQEIAVSSSFENAKTPAIAGSNLSSIHSSLSDLTDMFNHTLLNSGPQIITATWHFEKLKVLGKLNSKGKINKMNLTTDAVRHDAESNIVTGRKSIKELFTGDLYGLNFHKWADNALTMKKGKMVTVKGRKFFNNASFNDLSVFGTIMGVRLEEALTKTGDQKISGRKRIEGSVNTSTLFIDGLLNDVNLTDLVNHQLKKRKESQTIKTKIVLLNSFNIRGNLTMNDAYDGLDLSNLNRSFSEVTHFTDKVKSLLDTANAVDVALKNRAIYINKFEDAHDVDFVEIPASIEEKTQCSIGNATFLCAKDSIMHRITISNSSEFILFKWIQLNDDLFVVTIDANVVVIYQHEMNKNLTRLMDLHVPRVINAFVEAVADSMWIVVQLASQTLAVYWHSSQDFQQYVLPATDVFQISKSPNGQVLLFLSDGLWELKEGLARPRNIIGMRFPSEVKTVVQGSNYYLKYARNNQSALMKARYVGN